MQDVSNFKLHNSQFILGDGHRVSRGFISMEEKVLPNTTDKEFLAKEICETGFWDMLAKNIHIMFATSYIREMVLGDARVMRHTFSCE